MNKKLNTAIIAFGKSGEIFHAPYLHANEKFNLTAVLERHSERSKQIYPYINIVRKLSDILSDNNIDLVVVTSPNATHYSTAKKCLEAKKHVIIEKPFTVTSGEAEDLFKTAKGYKVTVNAFHNRRWDGDFLTVKKIIESGMIGDLKEYESHFDRFRNIIKPDSWKEEDKPGIGLLYDLGPHLIDQAVSLFGKPKSVYADLRKQRKNTKTIDNFDLILDYGRLKVQLKAGYLVKEKGVRFIIRGTKGSFIKYGLDPQEDDMASGKSLGREDWGKDTADNWGKLYSDINGLNCESAVETLPGNYMNFFNNIYDVIVSGAEPEIKHQLVILTLKIIEASYKSSLEKRAVEVS